MKFDNLRAGQILSMANNLSLILEKSASGITFASLAENQKMFKVFNVDKSIWVAKDFSSIARIVPTTESNYKDFLKLVFEYELYIKTLN